MRGNRFFFINLFGLPKSRFILFLFLGVSAMTGVAVFSLVDKYLLEVGVNRQILGMMDYNLGAYLMSVYVRFLLVLMAGVIGAGFTAVKVLGAGHRIERWLEQWNQGRQVEELRIRANDKFWFLTKLLNEWYRQTHK